MKLDDLRTKIIESSQAYYSGNPIISDIEFDTMILQLEELSPGDELLQQISYGYSPDKDTSGEKIPHKYLKVGSLAKINKDTCEKYFSSRKKTQYVITSKIDGGSIVCYYDDKGKFNKAITRGDGQIGIDCTSKLKSLVPPSIPLSNVAIRGEIIMKQSIFNEFYPDAASPRNTSLGIINKDDPTEDEIKRLTFLTYNVYGDNDSIPKKKSEVMEWLYENRFSTVKWVLSDGSNSPLFENMKGELNLEYPSDGLVLTNEHNPEDQIAYKFVAETAETTVTGVTWEGSRLGNLIPVVHFNTIKLSGANLNKCSGFNARWIWDNLITPGTKIIVHRSGEVIPYIKEIMPINLWVNPNIEFQPLPTSCPICQTELKWKGVHLYCPNEYCSSKTQSNLLHWCNTIARIDSLGENILIPFIFNIGWKTISNIYESSETNWLILFECLPVTTHAHKLLMEMYKKLYETPIDPVKFFAGFGLPSVGETISKRIIQEIGIDAYFNGENQKIKTFSNVSYIAINSLNENYEKMREVYLKIKERQGFIKKVLNQSIIKVVITGKLSKGRKELIEEFALHGIEVVGSVSKEIKYLITDDPTSGSSKNIAAQKLGIMVISEENFRKEMKI